MLLIKHVCFLCVVPDTVPSMWSPHFNLHVRVHQKSISGELRVEGGYRPMSATEERASQQQKMMEDELGEKSLEERLACTGTEKRKCT